MKELESQEKCDKQSTGDRSLGEHFLLCTNGQVLSPFHWVILLGTKPCKSWMAIIINTVLYLPIVCLFLYCQPLPLSPPCSNSVFYSFSETRKRKTIMNPHFYRINDEKTVNMSHQARAQFMERLMKTLHLFITFALQPLDRFPAKSMNAHSLIQINYNMGVDRSSRDAFSLLCLLQLLCRVSQVMYLRKKK